MKTTAGRFIEEVEALGEMATMGLSRPTLYLAIMASIAAICSSTVSSGSGAGVSLPGEGRLEVIVAELIVESSSAKSKREAGLVSTRGEDTID
jgi:hypothetical protein